MRMNARLAGGLAGGSASTLSKGEDMMKKARATGIHLLSTREVLNARDCELADGAGLLLRCSAENATWVFRYTAPSGKRREMGLGTCIRNNAQAAGASLTQARENAGKARALLASVPPVDPIDERDKARMAAKEADAKRKAEKTAVSATLAREARAYHEKVIEPTKPGKFSADWINSLENHVPKQLWHKPIAEITRSEMLDFLRDIQHRMADTAIRVRRRLHEVFDDAHDRELIAVNPVEAVRAKLRKVIIHKRVRSHPALPFVETPAFLRSLRTQPGIAARCMEFTILTAARTGESVGTEWSEFDLTASLWTIPGERMKGGEEHRVYLCARAVEIVESMRGTGDRYVFPSLRTPHKPISNMGMLALLKRMQRQDITVHGFRSTFSTWANENAIARADVIEACLAHKEGDKIRAAYNRATFAVERRKLLVAWGEYLEANRPPDCAYYDIAGSRAG